MKKLIILVIGVFLFMTHAFASEATGTIETNTVSTGIEMSLPCPTGQHLYTTYCEPDVRSCTIANGQGQQTWTAGVWSACTVTSCNTGYLQISNTCVASGGGGGGGGGGISMDYCPSGDFSLNYYDGKCNSTSTGSTSTGTTSTGSTGSSYTGATYGSGIVFSDIDDSFAREDIIKLVNMGVIKGFPDGTFRPEFGTTRAEFLAMMMKTFSIDLTSTGVNTFVDISEEGSWVIPYLIKGKELGIVGGQMIDGKLKFRPNDQISRIEALGIIFKITKFDLTTDKKLEFYDEDFLPWMLPYVIKGKELGIISGQIIDGKRMFRPNDAITRAEAVRIIYNTLKLYAELKK